MRAAGIGLVALVALLGAGGRAAAFIIPELGLRKNAMGAVIGRPDDLSAIFHNPAGLTLLDGTNVLVNAGAAFLDTDIRLRPWPGSGRYIQAPVDAEGYYPTVNPTRSFAVIPMLVASTDVWSERLKLGFGLYVPNAAGAAFDERSVARFHMIDSYLVAGYATLAAAYRVTPWLSVGATVSLLYVRLHARRKLFPVLEGLDLSGLIGGDSELELGGDGIAAAGSFGVLWQPHPRFSVGLALLTRTEVTLEGDVRVKLGRDAVSSGSLEGRHATDVLSPWTLHAGLNWDVLRWLEVGGEIRYYVYSQLDEERSRISGISFLDELSLPRNYHDSWQVSGGARFTVIWLPALELLAGFHYDYPPAPARTSSVEQPSMKHVGLHSGARWRIDWRFRVGLAYAHYWYLQRRTDDSVTSPPSNFIGSGQSNVLTLVLEVHFDRALVFSRPSSAGAGAQPM